MLLAVLLIGAGLFAVPAMAAVDSVPYINKTLGDNENGTYTLGLDVTGSAETTSSASPVNVIIVYDVSNSMTSNPAPATYGSYGLDASGGGGASAGTYFQLYKYVNGSYSAVSDSENYSGTVYRYSNRQYTPYTGQRFYSWSNNRGIRRADAAEKTLYDFTTALFGYQDQTDPSNIQAALSTFSGSASTTQSWTSTASAITNRVSSTGAANSAKLSYSQGTNWEGALAAAYNLINASSTDDDPTYVVFITDGAPSRTGSGTGTNVSSQYSGSDSNYVAAMNESRLVYNATTATGGSFYGIYAFGTETDWLASLMYYAYNGSETTAANNGETFDTDGYYNASNTDELNEAISDIFSKIVDTMGVGQASITDGTTSSVTTTTGEISNLLVVDDTTFQYWLSWQVTTGENGTYTFTMPDKNNKNGGDDITYTVSVSGDTVTLSWSEAGTTKTATYTGTLQNNVLTIEWTGTTDFYNYTPPTATYNSSTGAVDWNLAGLGTLLDSVTYRVTFEVYPSQTTLDLIADLKNVYVEYDDLDANIKKYLSEDYTLATNTTASLTYTDTRTDDGQQTKEYTNPDPVGVSAAKEMAVSKQWSNTLDSRDNWKSKEITLYVTRDGTERYTIKMSDSTDWGGNVHISYGLMTVDSDGTINLLTTGHDYAFAESIEDTYDWQIESPTVRPMLINNTGTILLKVETTDDRFPSALASSTNANDSATGSDGYTYYKLTIDGTVEYYRADTEIASLTAINHRRSYLDVAKVITGDNVPSGDEFTFNITINNNATGADPDNLNSDYWVWFSIWDTNANAILTDATVASGTGLRYQLDDETVVTITPESGFNGYFCIPSGNAIDLNMKSNYSLRFLNLPVGATYTVTESSMPDGYSFVSIAGQRGYDADGSEDTDDDWTTESTGTASEQSITGTIDYTESAYKVTVTNKWNTIDVKLKKVDGDGNVLDGSTFTLTSGDTIVDTYHPGTVSTTDEETGEETEVDNGNPINLGGLGIGTYKFEETAPPASYKKADDVYFQVYKDTDGSLKACLVDASGAVLSDQSAITEESSADGRIYTITVENERNTKWIQFKKADMQWTVETPDQHTLSGAEFTLSADEEEYNLVSGTDGIMVCNEDEGTEAHRTGKFELVLSDMPYDLTETEAPAGYSMLTGEVKVMVQANGVSAMIGSITQCTVYTNSNSTEEKGSYDNPYIVVIKNNPGIELPQTGGPGTELFTAIGGILTAAAGAILTTVSRRKRKGQTA